MTSAAQMAEAPRYDVRTIVGGGVKLGVITAVGVAVFALVSRPLAAGVAETIVQTVLVLAGGAVCSFLPAHWVRPREVDGIAWTALLGFLGAVSFTVLDTVLLRPLSIYHWTWDQIGGGSGFWYISVWWMAAAVLAWLGGWITAIQGRTGLAVSVVKTGAQTVGIAVVLLAIMVIAGVGPFHAAVAALAFGLALVLHVPLAAMLQRR